MPARLDASRLEGLEAGFNAAYAARFGRPLANQRIEVVNWRIEGFAPAPLAPDRPTAGGATPAPGAARSRRAYFPDARAFIDTPVLIESALRAGERHHGPALIEQAGSTVVIGPGDRFEIDEFASLRITLGARASA